MLAAVSTVLAGLLLVPLLVTLCCPYLFQDVRYFVRLARLTRRVRSYGQRRPLNTVLRAFQERARRAPHKAFLLCGDEVLTYEQLDRRSSQAARALHGLGLRQGDCVAIFMGNEPAYVWLWLGLAKLGCPMACLNYNIRAKSLLHCFQCCSSRVLLASPELQDAVEEVLPSLKKDGVSVYYMSRASNTEGVSSFLDKVDEESSDPVPESWRSEVTFSTPALYIYTSGTTGLPKAATINHHRIWYGTGISMASGLRSDDVVYTSLPLYHSAALLVGLHGCIVSGATMVLRKKFSASQFWDDCRKYNVTVIQYIGELLRYLCNTPPKPNDRDHKVRMALGNGLRGDVWREFIKRFGDIQIYEFYASTEGNVGFLNYPRKIGAVGRMNYLQRVKCFGKWFPKYGDFLKAGSCQCHCRNCRQLQSCVPSVSPRKALLFLCDHDLKKVISVENTSLSVNNNSLFLGRLQLREVSLMCFTLGLIEPRLPVPKALAPGRVRPHPERWAPPF